MKVTRVIWSMSPSEARAPDIPFMRFFAVSVMIVVMGVWVCGVVWGSSLSWSSRLVEVHCL